MHEDCPEEGWLVFDLFSGVKALLDALAQMIGVDNPSGYSVTWPFSHAEIQKDPYLRLRIGPTFADLVILVEKLADTCNCPITGSIERGVSLVIDMCVDQGSIVPTFAHYPTGSFRIYRRGEQNQYRKVVFRAQLAWQNCAIPMSLTRFSKVMAILAHSEQFSDTFECGAETRGTVAVLRPELSSGDPIEVSHHLRDTGRLKIVDRKD